jgi:hypothetical protein
MSGTRISFPVYSLRNLKTPFGRKPGYRNHVAVIEVQDLPDLSEWRRINVRDPKLTGNLPNEIRESFLANLDSFVFLNRGIVLAVESLRFEKATKGKSDEDDSGVLHLVLSDPDCHGLLDGGHTYAIIRQNRETLQEKGAKQYVKVEIIEGFEDLVKLVEARNSSNQVKDESLMNLAKDFNKIKTALAKEPYADQIAYSEYETFPDGSPKPISIREIVSFLMAMDRENFSGSNHPINSYRSKAACLKHFESNPKAFAKIYPLITDILRLWDTIHLRLPDFYNAARGEKGDVSGGRFGRLTGVVWLNPAKTTRTERLLFLDKESQYIIPAGLKYPILGSFRALLEEDGKRYRWGIDPIQFFEDGLGKTLAATIGEFALETQNPSKTGKSNPVWNSCFQTADNLYLRRTRR